MEVNCADGSNPWTALVQHTDGAFYGTTLGGGDKKICTSCGTVYSLSIGLGPFVRPNPVLGKPGYTINVLGTKLTGTTQVTFNGLPTTFTVRSSTLLKVVVPSGATTGVIEVTTPGGTLSSNVAFQVLP